MVRVGEAFLQCIERRSAKADGQPVTIQACLGGRSATAIAELFSGIWRSAFLITHIAQRPAAVLSSTAFLPFSERAGQENLSLCS